MAGAIYRGHSPHRIVCGPRVVMRQALHRPGYASQFGDRCHSASPILTCWRLSPVPSALSSGSNLSISFRKPGCCSMAELPDAVSETTPRRST
jgi:hypothetical protein